VEEALPDLDQGALGVGGGCDVGGGQARAVGGGRLGGGLLLLGRCGVLGGVVAHEAAAAAQGDLGLWRGGQQLGGEAVEQGGLAGAAGGRQVERPAGAPAAGAAGGLDGGDGRIRQRLVAQDVGLAAGDEGQGAAA
jgi:hypothetical protein